MSTKIDWCDETWNPVTGCLHGCPYCYARKMARRFETEECPGCDGVGFYRSRHTTCLTCGGTGKIKARRPFQPVFHPDRLDIPQHWRKPRDIFVCSMADLFGDWVPNWWIQRVFEACEKAPWHKAYYFLTKNPRRYCSIFQHKPNYHFGFSADGQMELSYRFATYPVQQRVFISLEPLLAPLDEKPFIMHKTNIEWVIIGAQTNPLVLPKREWVVSIVEQCRELSIPVWMKDNLRTLGLAMIQEKP